MELTPMMQQYLETKNRHPDEILFFRLGDFYEMFFDDAKLVSRELGLTLTSRSGNKEKTPMCGVPYHAAESYVAKLINKGYKVAIAEQIGAQPHAVLMAIAVAASCAFATPVGTPPNTLVLGPGGYRFKDYIIAGTSLILVCLVVSLIVIPIVWPFFP